MDIANTGRWPNRLDQMRATGANHWFAGNKAAEYASAPTASAPLSAPDRSLDIAIAAAPFNRSTYGSMPFVNQAAQPVASQAAALPAPQAAQPVTNAAQKAPQMPASIGDLPPGTGMIRNNQTGQMTPVGQPQQARGGGGGGAPQTGPMSITGNLPKAPTAPTRTPTAMPVLSGGGGLFSAMVNFAGQASQAGTAIQNNRGNNKAYQNQMQGFEAEQRERMAAAQRQHDAEQRDADRQQRQGALDKGQAMDEKRLALEEKKLAQGVNDRLRPTDIVTGQDEMGNPIKQTVLLDIGKLGSDGRPIVHPISYQGGGGQSSAPAQQSFEAGQVYKDANGNRALYNGKTFDPVQ